jgi:tRNA modification GTPase
VKTSSRSVATVRLLFVRQIIDRTLELGGALAGPGEFTLRALSNGKINLAQAEAIRDLISAQTDAAVKQATRQLKGELSNTLDPFKEKLVEVIVLLESALELSKMICRPQV